MFYVLLRKYCPVGGKSFKEGRYPLRSKNFMLQQGISSCYEKQWARASASLPFGVLDVIF